MARKFDGEEIDRSVNSTNYTEFALKRKVNAKTVFEKAALIAIYIAIVVVIFLYSWWLGSLSLLAVVIAWYFTWPFTNVEFEYTTSSGELKFEKIYGGGRRRVCVVEKKIRDAALIAPYSEEICKKYAGAKKYDFRSSKKDFEDAYIAAFESGGEKELIFFRCTNKALKIFKYYNSATVESDTLKF